jgi:hypothetical protein
MYSKIVVSLVSSVRDAFSVSSFRSAQKGCSGSMTGGNAETDGRAVILHVDAELLQAQCCEEQLLDLRGDVVEGVLKVGRCGSIAIAEAEVVRGDNVKVAGELRD